MQKLLFIVFVVVSFRLLKPAFAASMQYAQYVANAQPLLSGLHSGVLSTDPSSFIGSRYSESRYRLGGGIAFLLILFGGFQILTSAGNPEQLTAGRELVTSAITGLLFVIFSLFILRLIGYNIFGIPGFG